MAAFMLGNLSILDIISLVLADFNNSFYFSFLPELLRLNESRTILSFMLEF